MPDAVPSAAADGPFIGSDKGSADLVDDKTAELQRRCEVILARAAPYTKMMEDVLAGVSSRDLNEVKAFSKAPGRIQGALEALMVLMGRECSWAAVKRALGDPGFLSEIARFDRSQLTEQRVEKVEQEYLAQFTAEEVRKQSFFAAAMVDWVNCVCAVYHIEKEARPVIDELKLLQNTRNKGGTTAETHTSAGLNSKVEAPKVGSEVGAPRQSGRNAWQRTLQPQRGHRRRDGEEAEATRQPPGRHAAASRRAGRRHRRLRGSH